MGNRSPADESGYNNDQQKLGRNDVNTFKGLLAATLLASAAAVAPAAAQDITLGFVTHAQGNPFIQQIIDGAQAAAKDLGVDLQVAQQPGSQAEGQLKLTQNFANAGAQGVATSIQGEGMTRGLNELVDAGVKIVQYNTLSTNINAPYVGEKSVESGRVLGKMIVEKLGGADAKGTVIVGICFPGIQVLENRSQGVQESLKAAPGLNVLGPFDVKVSEVENYNRWEQLYAANPETVAMVGLCAPDIASLGKLNAANGDKFVAGGYDLTEPNLKAIQDGHAFVSIGQSAFVQGYLPVALMVDAIKNDKPLEVGFYDAGAQIVTADTVDMGNGLPAISFEEAIKLAGDPAATAEYYKAWADKVKADPTAGMQPIAAEAE
ncbi:ABC-type sugar transport system, substrate-binding protein, contains N-terminal xre family HTH domain [Bauldia litoralis]|uniref:ABC-type sugar transport system, substrate-binding protein, contains N-terminal xre family HTH domain n=1 Tax=Bauldia litoralis TaxID=665467 RepID=A0A1G6BMY4_9HYPH|nr:ABC-type sugar transport system, substrate-binding protein, contains N-terminal xre family HTH domain [Bauldia litoralis]